MAVTRTTRGSGRAALTAAAREVIAERGYHGASIRDIAARAGLSLAALYHWHSGKQDLLVEVLRESRQDYLDTCRAAFDAAPPDPSARLAALVRATVDYRVRRRVESEISAREWRHVEPEHLGSLDEFRVAAGAMWSGVIDDGVRAGVFGCDHPDEARRAIEAAVNAIPQWYDPSGPMGADELADRYVAIARRIVEDRT
jgi:AcrR family transcriptional regulator